MVILQQKIMLPIINHITIVDVNDVHEKNMHENVHDDHSSMSAQTMLNLGLHKKGFKMGH